MSPSRIPLSRRNLFAGAAAAGALGAAATLVPQAVQPPAALPEVREPPERGGGYHLSEHVLQYYKTTRL